MFRSMRGPLAAVAIASLMALMPLAASAQKKPNILVIWGDDIGMDNISAYHRGMMGGRTPNIDRLAKEGVIFTDHYAQQSCTAGRASFIMGQHPFRTGLLTIGMPGRQAGHRGEEPDDRRTAQANGVMRPLRSGRTILAIATSICPRYTASITSTATCTTSTPRKSQRTRTTRRIPNSMKCLGRAAFWIVVPPIATTQRSTLAGAVWASRPSRIRAP